MDVIKVNEEVLYPEPGVVRVGRDDVGMLKEQANRNRRQRIRLCAHSDVEDTLHEMFIVHKRDTYVRPHKHLNKSESTHIIEGSVDMVMFDEDGQITDVCRLGDYGSGLQFFHRISEPTFHTLLINSETLVFHETTNGPFRPPDTVWATWAPDIDDDNGAEAYVDRLRKRVSDSVMKRARDQ